MSRSSKQGILPLPLIIICAVLAWLLFSSLRTCMCSDHSEMEDDVLLDEDEDNAFLSEDDYDDADETLPQKMGKAKKKKKPKKKGKKHHKKGKKHDDWSGF